MALSLPRKITVEAINKSTVALIQGYVVQLIVTRNADGDLVSEAYAVDKSSAAGSTQLDQVIMTIGVCESLSVAAGDVGSFCVAGETLAFCDADGADIDSNAALFVADDNIGNAVKFTLTNNAALSSNNNGGANAVLSGVLGATELETVLTALRGRANDPLGGALSNGADLVVDGSQGNVKIVLYNNPIGPFM
tara:strand:+ start:859 stop:1437 length:579 start_codon:yes stop_codon:yes gene_type:complete